MEKFISGIINYDFYLDYDIRTIKIGDSFLSDLIDSKIGYTHSERKFNAKFYYIVSDDNGKIIRKNLLMGRIENDLFKCDCEEYCEHVFNNVDVGGYDLISDLKRFNGQWVSIRIVTGD